MMRQKNCLRGIANITTTEAFGKTVYHPGHIGLGEPDDLAVVIYEFSWRLAVFAFHLFAELGRTLD